MALHDVCRTELAHHPTRVVVVELDEFSHVSRIAIREADNRWVMDLDRPTLKRLVGQDLLLTAPDLTPDRTYVHRQPPRAVLARPSSKYTAAGLGGLCPPPIGSGPLQSGRREGERLDARLK